MDTAPDLYALPPEEFTAARDAAAKQDRSLKALRRPSVAAWVVNTLVRHEPDLLAQLLEVGRELAEAQRDGQGAALRELTEQRRQLVDAVTEQALSLVDRTITPAVRAEVAGTLDAALVDPASGEAVASGQLVRALSFAGFGGVDLDGAVAPAPRPERSSATAGDATAEPPRASRADVEAAERATHEAAGALDDAVRHLRHVRAGAEASREHERTRSTEREQAQQAVELARTALAAAERAALAADQAQVAAHEQTVSDEQEAAAGEQAVAQAQLTAEQARARLDGLRRGRA